MSETTFSNRCILRICLVIFFPCVISLPIIPPDNLYDKFILSLVENNCEMPNAIYLPFEDVKDIKHFSFLSAPLMECRTPEALKVDEEAHLLCEEIFEVIRELSCSKLNASFPEIKSVRNFSNVCEEFSSMKNVLPKKDKYLSGKFVDNIVCKLLCSEKFQTLCQTLLWGYDVQLLVKKAGNTLVADDKKTDDEAETGIEDLQSKIKNVPQEPVLDRATDNNPIVTDSNLENDNIDQTIKKDSNGGLRDTHDQVTQESVKSINSSVTAKVEALTESQKTSVSSALSNIFQNRVVLLKNSTITTQGTLQVDTNKNLSHVNDEIKNEGNTENQTILHSHEQTENTVIEAEPNKFTGQQSIEVSKNSKVTTATSQDLGSNKNNTPASNYGTEAVPFDVNTNKAEENEVNAVNLKDQKPKETVEQNNLLVPHDEKEQNVEKPQVANDNTLEKATIDSSLKLDSTTLQAYPDQNVEEDPDDRDSDQYYKDTENEDYPKAEYENTLNDLKARKPAVKSSVVSEVAIPNDVRSSYDLLPSRNNYVRGLGDTPMISSFPEQEDSHFFFYFLSIVLILMAGYLLVHNKQKIIALIIEGRHERRRRSHGAGYKKLDTK